MKHRFIQFTTTVVEIILITFLFGIESFAAPERGNKPNVIVIMTDDQGNNLGFQGNPFLTTPHMDKLAEESVRLTNFHQAPMCTASRAALMTGKYAEQTGAWRTSLGRTLMRPDNFTVAEAFKAHGYMTGHFGKWHLGDNWPMRPQDQGFDEVVGHRCGAVGQIADYWGNDYFDDTYYHNGKPRKYEGYCTDVFFHEAMRFVKENKTKPFFVYLAPNVTHLPLLVAEKYSRPYIDRGMDRKLAVLYGMIDNLDENFGRLSAFLKKEGLDENTIILFTTDDGVQGSAVSNTPDFWNMGMRGKKGSKEEGGHRVFCCLRWPAGTIGAGRDNNTLISVMDVYPTLMELCGLELPAGVDLTGRSFKPYLNTPLDPKRDDRTLFFYYFNPKKLNDRRDSCVIWRNWRLLGCTHLYDISRDRMQARDIAREHPKVVSRMTMAFDAYHKEGLKLIKEPVRFILGDARAPKVELTSQDVYRPAKGGPQAFTQNHALDLLQARGPYKVTLTRSGSYTFTLSRYPLYTGKSFGEGRIRRGKKEHFEIKTVRMAIMDRTVEKNVTPEDTHVSFTLDLEAGEADLETWLIGNGMSGTAYFVTVNFND